jgi:putative ABC transport system permease protein
LLRLNEVVIMDGRAEKKLKRDNDWDLWPGRVPGGRSEREMGIRLALGASTSGLKVFVVSAVLRWVAAGIVSGLGIAQLCAQYLKPFVYQIAANDPATLAFGVTAFVVAAGAASYLPARRATRVDPMIALRSD